MPAQLPTSSAATSRRHGLQVAADRLHDRLEEQRPLGLVAPGPQRHPARRLRHRRRGRRQPGLARARRPRHEHELAPRRPPPPPTPPAAGRAPGAGRPAGPPGRHGPRPSGSRPDRRRRRPRPPRLRLRPPPDDGLVQLQRLVGRGDAQLVVQLPLQALEDHQRRPPVAPTVVGPHEGPVGVLVEGVGVDRGGGRVQRRRGVAQLQRRRPRARPGPPLQRGPPAGGDPGPTPRRARPPAARPRRGWPAPGGRRWRRGRTRPPPAGPRPPTTRASASSTSVAKSPRYPDRPPWMRSFPTSRRSRLTSEATFCSALAGAPSGHRSSMMRSVGTRWPGLHRQHPQQARRPARGQVGDPVPVDVQPQRTHQPHPHAAGRLGHRPETTGPPSGYRCRQH